MPPHPTPLPGHVCEQETAIAILQKDVVALQDVVRGIMAEQAAQGQQLGEGRVEFMSVKKDLAQIIAAITEMKAVVAAVANAPPPPPPPISRMEQVIAAAINGGVPVIILSILYAVAKSGQIPGVK